MGAEMSMALIQEDQLGLYDMWEKVQMRLKKEYGKATYTSWIKHLQLEELDNNEVILSVPTRFIREWIINHYADKIEEFWRDEKSKICKLTISVKSKQEPVIAPAHEVSDRAIQLDMGQLRTESTVTKATQEPEHTDSAYVLEKTIAGGVDVTGQNVGVLNVGQEREPFGSPLDRRFTFDHFVVGKSNQLAFAASRAIAESEDITQGKNPFYLYGKVGLGKTHLMHAIALYVREHHPHRSVAYLSAERFMYQFVNALKNKDIMNFKDRFRGIDMLLIDDVQFICGKESTQEEFFHTVNALMDQNKQLVIASDRSPSELDGMQERIRTRLGWGLVVDINSADFDLRLGILKSKVAQMVDVEVPTNVLEFLASRISSSIRELEGALNKVVAHATLMKLPVTLDGTQAILTDLLRANERILTISDIQKKVAAYYDIKLTDMSSANRSRNVARPRQIAMFLSKKLTPRSLSEIGRKFGGKDHTTVMHAIKRIEDLLQDDEEVKAEVAAIERTCCQS